MGVTSRLSTAARAEAERRAVSGLLAWEGVARASNLARLLGYLAEMHFSGRSGELKEYTVAMEAFGRPADFDPKRDSIVRVEAHRLRKALQRYYESGGAQDAVRVELPPGSYVLVFRHHGDPLPTSTAAAGGKRISRVGIAGALGALSLVPLGALLLRSKPQAPMPAGAAESKPVDAAGEAIRIRCGADAAFTDSYGRQWLPDRFFAGGKVMQESPRFIRNTLDPALYLQRREGDCEYAIPLAPGVYELRLHFAETQYGPENAGRGGENSRVFSVRANGHPIIPGIDVLSDAGGGNTANIRVFKNIRPGQDGMLRLSFVSLKWEKPIINAIELAPGIPNLIHPVRIATAPHDVTDRAGRVWMADRYFMGGQSRRPPDPATGTGDDELYVFHRFGHFTYTIPVAPDGRYTLRLLFAEHNFGPGRPGGSSAGRRVFHVFCNGEALLRNFDLLAEAPPLTRVERVFRNLAPSAQSKLVLQFVPVRNYALVNAIEVLDESPR